MRRHCTLPVPGEPSIPDVVFIGPTRGDVQVSRGDVLRRDETDQNQKEQAEDRRTPVVSPNSRACAGSDKVRVFGSLISFLPVLCVRAPDRGRSPLPPPKTSARAIVAISNSPLVAITWRH